MKYAHLPEKQGLYDPAFEHDSCGVGFVCDIKGQASHAIIQQGLEVLRRLSHRGATGADPKTGDGAGILLQMPHEFLAKAASAAGIKLPAVGCYGAGLVFLPRDVKERNSCQKIFHKIIAEEGQKPLGWRDVPVNNAVIGETAKSTEPFIAQIFIEKNEKIKSGMEFERILYVIRKRVENVIRASALKQKAFFYITNISSRTMIYKGLLMPRQMEEFFPDLTDANLTGSLAIVHSRYSTNTFPTWDLAQPFRFIAHNGEINTLRGNINWMKAREGLLDSEYFGAKLKRLLPVIVPGGSDSAIFDNVFELFVLSGRSLEHAMAMMIPAAWEESRLMSREHRDFYKYHACLSENWDGPAAMAFTDGTNIGAVLDRNGLRPARYIVTRQGCVIMASEMGVLDIEPQDIAGSAKLEPGKIFFIDTRKGRIVGDREIKDRMAQRKPYGLWLKEKFVEFNEISSSSGKNAAADAQPGEESLSLLQAFGYTREDLRMILAPMAEDAKEPIGSMGNDTPLAVLSQRPRLLYDYFKQLFAQVTNPAIDSIREEVVMSLQTYLGPGKNVLDESPEHCHKICVKNPIWTNRELAKIRDISVNGFKTKTITLLFKAGDERDFLNVLERICRNAVQAIREGYSFIILSDRGVNSGYAAIPALLAAGAVHHHLVRKCLRTQISLIMESAEPREVHHLALLFGYGMDCINPYLAFEAIAHLIRTGELTLDMQTAIGNYIHALEKGILKILSKMGISTLQSYRGAQIFEALGIGQAVIERSFAGTPSRIGGIDLKTIFNEVMLNHRVGFPESGIHSLCLASGGLYHWKKDGELHLWNPETISSLQEAARNNDYECYRRFSRLVNEQGDNPVTLRGLFRFKKTKPVPLKEVEAEEEIFKRFAAGAMSFGSISKGAHETLAIAMNRLGGRSNTGEGGEDPARFVALPGGDSLRSSIKQVASGRFGVTTNYLVNADELQIKIAQGAKPGEGGQLPGHKVSSIIAKTRYTTEGVTLISPPPHHDIYSIEDLAQLIFDLKNVNPRARISVKLVSEIGVGTVAAGVAKGHADMILISGGDGGTGASPLSSIKHAGLPWELGLAETHQTLVLNNLRSRVRLQTDGQLRTGRDVAIAAILGAEEYAFATSALITMGCVMLRHCHLNNCLLGVATQDEQLQCRFKGKPEYVVNYFTFVARELREIMAELGVRSVNELIGRADLLEMRRKNLPWKAKKVDPAGILFKVDGAETYCRIFQDHRISDVLDKKIIELAEPAIKEAKPCSMQFNISNINRSTGAMLSGRICRLCGEQGLPDDTIHCKFTGIAGQSFGAWLARGVTFELEGMANDYVGKGISGGKIIIYPDRKSGYESSSNVIIGNTTFYGAIYGEAYIRGAAGERFCIRNSGLNAVVEGVGDHGCEYMTGGRVVVLGKTGINFGAGMSGGIAYIYDMERDFSEKCNKEMVAIEKLNAEDKETVHQLLSDHVKYTRSMPAESVLRDFSGEIDRFVKVMPLEYKRILEKRGTQEVIGGIEEGE